jgi:hypothetical protein
MALLLNCQVQGALRPGGLKAPEVLLSGDYMTRSASDAMSQLFDHAIVHSGGKPSAAGPPTGQTNISRQLVLCQEIRHEEQNSRDHDEADLHQPDKGVIGMLVSRVIVTCCGRIFHFEVVGHRILLTPARNSPASRVTAGLKKSPSRCAALRLAFV